MAFDAFLKVEGVDGESNYSKHPKWIEICRQPFVQPPSSTVSSAGGAGAGRVTMQDFSIVKHIDSATPKLAEACCTGKHFPSAIIEICRAGGDKLNYMEYKMTEVMVSRAASVAPRRGATRCHSKRLPSTSASCSGLYVPQDRATGAGKGSISAGWDFETNQKV